MAAAYGQTLWFDFVKDDHWLIASRVSFRDVIAAPHLAYRDLAPTGAVPDYRPLLGVSVALDRAWWGPRPGGFHLSNVLAHLAVVLLLWRLAWRMTESTWAALAAGALLAVHPSAVEAVTFVAARTNLFVGLGTAAVVLLLRGSLGPSGRWRLGGALLCFAFALGSKETALAIPAMVTWGAWVFPEWFAGPGSRPSWTARAALIAPFWGILVVYGAVRQAEIGSLAPVPVGLADMPGHVLRALVATATYTEMTLVSGPTTGFNIAGKVALPTGLADERVFAGLAVVGILVGSLLWLRRRHPAAAFALGGYGAALVPISNLLPIHWEHAVYVGERSLYPALVFWCLFLAVTAHALVGAAKGRAAPSWPLVKVLGGAVLGTLLVVTVVKGRAWRNDVSLWTAAVAANPDSVETRLNLAIALAQAGDLQMADAHVREAEALLPEDPNVAYMAGWVAQLRGEPQEALRQYERALTLGTDLWRAFRDAAVLAAQLQEWDRAGRWFAAAADRFPRAAWPQVGLGWYRQRQGRADLARAHFERAAQLEPSSPERARLLGQLLAAEGRAAEALDALRTAHVLDPWYVPANRDLALLLEREGRFAEAIGLWRRIAQALPRGQQREALEHLRRLESRASGAPAGGSR